MPQVRCDVLFLTYLIVMCDSAGIMFWGDVLETVRGNSVGKIEASYLDGRGRATLLAETSAHYFAFALHDGNIYFSDWLSPYVSARLGYVMVKVTRSPAVAEEPREHAVS